MRVTAGRVISLCTLIAALLMPLPAAAQQQPAPEASPNGSAAQPQPAPETSPDGTVAQPQPAPETSPNGSAAPERPANAPRRRALLIGVRTYRPTDYQPAGLGRMRFSNLVTTCDGVTAISARLQALGWSFDPDDPNSEVQEFCDADPDRVLRLLSSTVSEFNRENDLLIIYLAGHGVEVEGRNYFFSPNALVDIPEAVRLLGLDGQNLLFVGQAFDLEGAILRPAGRFYSGNILLILDTCRNDIVFETMGRELRIPAGAPQSELRPTGVSILYANTPGARIADGTGLSHLARAFDQVADRGLRIDTIVSRIRKHVIDQTRALPADRIQNPIRINDLNNTDLCLAGCPIFAASAAGAARAKTVARAPATKQAPTGAGAAPGREFRSFMNIARSMLNVVGTVPIGVDIYWCRGPGENRRAQQATQLGISLSRQPAIFETGAGGARVRLDGIRTQAISRNDNARPEFRMTSDVARIDGESPHAAAVAALLRRISATPIRTQRVRSRTGTVDVFLCEGVAPFPEQNRLWLQVARSEQRGVATYLGGIAESEIANLWVADAVEVEPTSPTETQIRYFYPGDRQVALNIAATLGPLLPRTPRLVYLPQYGHSVARGLVELWIGGGLDPATVTANTIR